MIGRGVLLPPLFLAWVTGSRSVGGPAASVVAAPDTLEPAQLVALARDPHAYALTLICIVIHTTIMTTRRITANLPENLLEEAMETTGKGITATITEGLELVRRTRAHRKAMDLKGRLDLGIDLDESRERRPDR